MPDMAGSPKETLKHESATEEAVGDERELYLSDGRKVVVSDQLVEIRSPSGMLELRVKLTEQGPVLQMEAVRLEMKATEAVEIEAPRVAIKTTEDIDVTAEGEVRVVGKKIHLN